MKERINISIEYSLIKEIRELNYINNLSRYIEKCLTKSLNHYKKINNIVQTANRQNKQVTEEDIKALIKELEEAEDL